MAVTRRQFLQQVGITGGAGVMFSTMGAMGLAPTAEAAPRVPFVPLQRSDFNLTGRGRKSVVILGAGIGGMTAAYELQKAGYTVTLIEGRARPGGRNWTVRKGDTETDLDGETQEARFHSGEYMNAGPARIPQHHVTLDYCRELGVAIEPFINQNADGYLYREGTSAMSNQPIRHRTARADTYGYVAELLAKATDQGSLDTYLAPEDKERLISFLRSFGSIGPKVEGDPLASYAYTGSGRRGYITPPGGGQTPGEIAAPYALPDVLASGMGNYFSFESGWDQAMAMFQPVGGMDRIAYAFEEAIGKENFLYEADIRSFGNTSTGAEVEFLYRGRRMRKVEADYLICTLPPHIAARIPSNLPPEVNAANAFAVPSRSSKLGVEYDRRWWEEDERIYGGITNSNLDLANTWYPSSGFFGRRGVMVAYYSSAPVYNDSPHASRVERAMSQLELIHGPKVRQDVGSTFSVAWLKTQYSEAAWVGWPDRLSGQYDLLLQPTGNIYFAGDHLSYTIAWQHGAMESARQTVMNLHSRVMSA